MPETLLPPRPSPLRSRIKTALVDFALVRVPVTLQAPLFAIVRRVWPGFRHA